MTPPTRDRSPLWRSQLTSDARRRPRPTSTRVPTTDRTIWWQNDVAAMSNRSRRASGPSSPGRTGTSTKRASRTRLADGGPRARSPARAGRRPGSRAHRGGRPRRWPWPGGRGAPGTCHDSRRQQGVRGQVLEDEVAVAPRPGRAAGVEAGRGHLGRPHHHGGLEEGVHRPHQPVDVDVLAHVDVDHLAPGVDPGIGAPCAHELDGVADDEADGARPAPPPRCAARAGRRIPGTRPRRRTPSSADAWSAPGGPRRVGASAARRAQRREGGQGSRSPTRPPPTPPRRHPRGRP